MGTGYFVVDAEAPPVLPLSGEAELEGELGITLGCGADEGDKPAGSRVFSFSLVTDEVGAEPTPGVIVVVVSFSHAVTARAPTSTHR